MSTSTQIEEKIQSRLGRIQNNTIIVNETVLFDIKQINDGVLTVWPEWSPQGFINCILTIQYLYDRNYRGDIFVINIDDIITAESQIHLFGHVLHGWGEVFIINQGAITEEFLGKESFAQFKARFETIESSKHE
jgi:hypothetical protein